MCMMYLHSTYSYTFTQGRNDTHAQKNMNVYDVFTFQCTIIACVGMSMNVQEIEINVCFLHIIH